MPDRDLLISPIYPTYKGSGGITGANSHRLDNVETYVRTQMRYHATVPRGEAVGKHPAYGSVGTDGHWPGKSR